MKKYGFFGNIWDIEFNIILIVFFRNIIHDQFPLKEQLFLFTLSSELVNFFGTVLLWNIFPWSNIHGQLKRYRLLYTSQRYAMYQLKSHEIDTIKRRLKYLCLPYFFLLYNSYFYTHWKLDWVLDELVMLPSFRCTELLVYLVLLSKWTCWMV